MANRSTGLFSVKYDITTGLAGAPVLHLTLAVDTVHKTVAGCGCVTQATNPPLDVHSVVNGDFTYMTVMPKITHILLVAEGHAPERCITPVTVPNLSVRAVLDESWDSGT